MRLSLLFCLLAAAVSMSKPLNVLMIAIDDMRPEMTPYGHGYMHTPNLARLANRSMLFERAYVQVALCMPSRTSLLTSRRADTTMNWQITPNEWFRTCGGPGCHAHQCGSKCGMGNAKTLPEWFFHNGYFTIGMGKIFHEGADTRQQDYLHSWTPSTTNPTTGIWEASGGPEPKYNGSFARPTWYAFDVDDEKMTETMLAEHARETIKHLANNPSSKPFFLAVGFHKPHVPWYAPKKYWDFYPEDQVTLAPHTHEPEGVPKLAMQSVIRGWSTPHKTKLDCTYIDLCAEIYQNMSKDLPYDNTTIPDWKARQLRRAYWAALSYTDANIGRVLDALESSPFNDNTVIALWGDHGYQLGDNANWAKQTNFEHATRIPFLISVPGHKAGHTPALVEAVDLFPTLAQAATGTVIPACPAGADASRKTQLCTEGRSLLPLITGEAGWHHRGAISQFPRGSTMGYTLRVNQWRYTGWFPFDIPTATADLTTVVARELYQHSEPSLPVDWSVEHVNLASDAGHQAVVQALHTILVKCAQRPNVCTSADFAPWV